jgi:hypothetical protein
MKKTSWQVIAAICLLTLSAIFYFIDYLITGSANHIAVSLLDNIAFGFVYIFLTAVIVDSLITNNEKRGRMEKLNMVIGVFFNEVGTSLLSYLAKLDTKLDTMSGDIMVTAKWTDREFADAGKRLLQYKYKLKIEPSGLEELRTFITGERDFLLRLLENPILLDHETFTELLLAVFHMADEFANRQDFSTLPENDRKHLVIDIERAYNLATREWLVYMKYLKSNYPYLLSLAVRKNPFDGKASVIFSD